MLNAGLMEVEEGQGLTGTHMALRTSRLHPGSPPPSASLSSPCGRAIGIIRLIITVLTILSPYRPTDLAHPVYMDGNELASRSGRKAEDAWRTGRSDLIISAPGEEPGKMAIRATSSLFIVPGSGNLAHGEVGTVPSSWRASTGGEQ
jgi:hypothetical protein